MDESSPAGRPGLGTDRPGLLRLGFLFLVTGLAGVALLGLSFGVGPAFAGDAVAQFELQPGEGSAEPGETVTVDVVLRTDGGYADEGVESYAFVVAVPPEVGEPTAVEPGPFLVRDGGSVDQTVADAGEGAIRVEHERIGAEGGATGARVAATVTVELREDAPAADAVVLVADPTANLYGSDYPMRTFGDEATVPVAGGGERLEAAYEPTGDGSGGSVDVTTANETNRSVDEGGGGSDDGGSSDPTPGFGLVVAVAALVGTALAVAGSGSDRRRRR